MTPDEVLDDIHASLTTADMRRHLDRPKGLTASALGVCRARAGFLIREETESDLPDGWLGQRGVYLHAGIQADMAEANPDLIQEERRSVTIAGLDIPVRIESYNPATGVLYEYKTMSPEELALIKHKGEIKASWRMQTAVEAVACGAKQAFVVAVGGSAREDWAAVEVDIPEAMAETELWLRSVLGEEQDSLPRDMHAGWCKNFCPFVSKCRTGFTDLSEELTDPWQASAVRVAFSARVERLRLEKVEKGAWETLRGSGGHVPATETGPAMKIVRWTVDATADRKAYHRQEIRLVEE